MIPFLLYSLNLFIKRMGDSVIMPIHFPFIKTLVPFDNKSKVHSCREKIELLFKNNHSINGLFGILIVIKEVIDK